MSSEVGVPAVEVEKDVAVDVAPVAESAAAPVTQPAETGSASTPKSEPESSAPATAEDAKPDLPAKDAESTPALPTKDAESTPAVPTKDTESSVVPDVPVKDAEPTPTTSAKDVASPLAKLYQELPAIYKEAEYREMWGIELSEDPETHVPTSIVATKFLRANTNDVSKAKKQLIEALQWRKKMQPLKLLESTKFDKSKYGKLGFVTTYEGTKGKEVVTWNIYGAVKDNKATFGNVEEFIKWRAALMELSIAQLALHNATVPIPESGPDPYRMIQVHDYLNVSFLRMDPAVKAASKQTISTFSMAYPELLKEKFFVNVPLLMSWVFAAMKVFLSPETVKKFHPLGYGEKLAGELPEFGEKLPKNYGGKSEASVSEGLSVMYADEETEPVAAQGGEEGVKKET